ncbi:MAG: winged helix-turn-helix transcriptional regulator [Anaerolineaceae bacterium]|nr:winged helix-turn-helix transcriptional regulator [Anaerolineaceae bacterium]
MNSKNSSDVKSQEYELLNAISEDSMVTQAGLSARLGIAVGSVNWYIKRLVNRGYVKVSHLDRTRLQYDLTPEGMSVLTQRALQYMKSSLQVYNDLRAKAKALAAELLAQGIPAVYLEGDDEAMDILRLTLIEAGIALHDKPRRWMLCTHGQNYQLLEVENS